MSPVSKMRHSLSDESVHAASVLGSWCNIPGIVPHAEIMEVFKNKLKQSKGKAKDSSVIELE